MEFQLRTKLVTAAALALLITGCVSPGVEMGSKKAESSVSGGTGGANSEDASSALERCDRALGTVAIDEDTSSPWFNRMGRYGVNSTVPILRLMAQQSNCFIVVERSRAGLKHIERERALMDSGELRESSNFGKGQLVAADYTIIPSLVFSDSDTGGAGAILGGLLGPVGALLGGSLSFADAQSVMTLVENRSGVQVAAAEGSARATNIKAGIGLFGGAGIAGFGGYTKTPEGKVIVGAMMDAFNTLVRSTRNYKAQTVDNPNGLGSGGSLGVDGADAPAQSNLNVKIKKAQAALNTLGYNVGRPDGKVGPMTRKAVKAFQQDNGLKASGRLDPATLRMLLSY